MATKVLSKKEAENLGLLGKPGDVASSRRVNPHVQELMNTVKGTKPGQFLVYEPADRKSFQTQILRIRQAFDTLAKPWPFTKPLDGGKKALMQILSKSDSFERYPQQPMATKTEKVEPVAKAPKTARRAGKVKRK